MNWFKIVIYKFGEFEGRSRRKEFWLFFLFAFIFGTLISLLDRFIFSWDKLIAGIGPLEAIFGMFILIPFLAVLVRRLHDIGKKWTWMFIAFVPILGQIMIIYLLSKKGDKGENYYGQNPKKIT